MVARQAGQIYAIAAGQVTVSGAQSSDINATGMVANVRVARIIAMHAHRLMPRASADWRGIKKEKEKHEAVYSMVYWNDDRIICGQRHIRFAQVQS